jgi:osmotically-inducible protein OsmY
MAVVPDSELEKTIHERMVKAGIHLDQVRAIVDRGNVRLVGTLQFENQRRAFLKLVSSVDGVQRVDDQMMVEMKKKK